MLSHADPSVCSSLAGTILRNRPDGLLLTFSAPSILSTPPFPFAGALPVLDSVPNCHSNPITQRVRRKRQRLPPSLLIENVSNAILRLPGNSSPEAFPIKASDHPEASEASRESVRSTWFSHLVGSDVTSELRTEKC